METVDAKYSYKLILVGDGGVGKTTFVRRHIHGEFNIKYRPTVGCSIHGLDFTTNKGKVMFWCWDTAGQEKFGGLRDGYYIGADCGIIMFDLSQRNSYQSVPIWYRDVSRIIDRIPIAVVGNKNDIRDPFLGDDRLLLFRRKYGMQYIEISARKSFNYERPFLYLFRRLQDDPSIIFTEELAVVPKDTLPMDQLSQEQIKKTLLEATDVKLPQLL